LVSYFLFFIFVRFFLIQEIITRHEFKPLSQALLQ